MKYPKSCKTCIFTKSPSTLSCTSYYACGGPLLGPGKSIAGLTDRELPFRMGIILGTIPNWFLVSYIDIPDCCRNFSGNCPYLVVQMKLSDLDRGPKLQDSIMLNSWVSFSVTFPYTSSDPWVMYFSVIPETNVFSDYPFLAFSCVSLETAANFCLLP